MITVDDLVDVGSKVNDSVGNVWTIVEIASSSIHLSHGNITKVVSKDQLVVQDDNLVLLG